MHLTLSLRLWDNSCPIKANCSSGGATACKKFHVRPAYRVGRPNSREDDIKYELMTQGPVQAVMAVYSDFFMYKSGVYSRSNLALGGEVGFHAVRIVGWGEEGAVKFWKVANSWGEDWGERGYFRIQRGRNECMIEEFVVGAWPRKQRKGRRRRTRRHR